MPQLQSATCTGALPETAQADAALDDGNLLPEDMNDFNPHPAGIQVR